MGIDFGTGVVSSDVFVGLSFLGIIIAAKAVLIANCLFFFYHLRHIRAFNFPDHHSHESGNLNANCLSYFSPPKTFKGI